MSGSFLNLAGADFWVNALLATAVKSALIAVCALILLYLLRRKSASIRHSVLASSFVVLLVLPVLTLTLPAWEVPVLKAPPLARSRDHSQPQLPVRKSPHAARLQAGKGSDSKPQDLLRQSPSVAQPPEMTTAPRSEPLFGGGLPQLPARGPEANIWILSAYSTNWPQSLVLAWAIGCLLFAARLLLGLMCVRRAVFRANPVVETDWNRLAEEAARILGMRRKVALFVSKELEVALSAGILHPVVLLPEISETWTTGRRRSILLHEFSHIRRWDNAINLIAQWCCTLYWFNPLVWWAAARLLVERERACDDQVLSAGTRASEYATHLLEVARAISKRRFWAELEISQSSALKDRVMAVLDPARSRLVPTWELKFVVFALLSIAVLPFSALQPWKSSDSQLAEAVLIQRLPLDSARGRGNVPRKLQGEEWVRDSLQPLQRRPEADSRLVKTGSAALDPRGREKQSRVPSVGEPAPPSSSRVLRVRLLSGELPVAEPVDYANLFPGNAYPAGRLMSEFAPTRSYTVFRRRASGGATSGGAVVPASGAVDDPPLQLAARLNRMDIGSLGGFESSASDINDSGQVVGESQTAGFVVHPFLWSQVDGMLDLAQTADLHTRATKINQKGQVLCETFNTFQFKGYVWAHETGLVDVGSLDSRLPLTIPNAMNESGWVVGASRDATGILKAFVWTEDVGLQDLGAPGWSEALALNGSGQVVGYANNDAFVWEPERGVELVTPPGSRFAIATAINEGSQVVGYAEDEGGELQAFLWTRAQGHVSLGALSPDFPITLALGINGQGVVVGQALSAPGQSPIQIRAFRWTLEEGMQDIGASVQQEGAGPVPETRLTINALGQVIGIYADDYGDAQEQVAMIWTEAGAIPLIADESSPGAFEAVAANNRNQIVGSSFDSDQSRRATLWELRYEFVAQPQ